MAVDPPDLPNASRNVDSLQHTTTLGGVLADQTFGEERDEVETGKKLLPSNAMSPAKPTR